METFPSMTFTLLRSAPHLRCLFYQVVGKAALFFVFWITGYQGRCKGVCRVFGFMMSRSELRENLNLCKSCLNEVLDCMKVSRPWWVGYVYLTWTWFGVRDWYSLLPPLSAHRGRLGVVVEVKLRIQKYRSHATTCLSLLEITASFCTNPLVDTVWVRTANLSAGLSGFPAHPNSPTMSPLSVDDPHMQTLSSWICLITALLRFVR